MPDFFERFEHRVINFLEQIQSHSDKPRAAFKKFTETHDPSKAEEQLGISLMCDSYLRKLNQTLSIHGFLGNSPILESVHTQSDGKEHDEIIEWVLLKIKHGTHMDPSEQNVQFARHITGQVSKELLNRYNHSKHQIVRDELMLTARKSFMTGIEIADFLSNDQISPTWKHETQSLFLQSAPNLEEIQKRIDLFINQPPLSPAT